MIGRIGLQQQLAWARATAQALDAYQATHSVRKLQLGTGTNPLDGWLNTDIVPAGSGVVFLDSTKRFPIEDATFDYVFSEHHIEHLSYTEGLVTLREAFRVLRPGGRIRIATPSLETLIGLYTAPVDELQQRYIRFITDTFLPDVQTYSPVFVLNNAFRNWGHQFLYDRATLQQTMEQVGFVEIASPAPGTSDDPNLRGIDSHGDFIGNEEMSRFETMVLEGRRP
ncbi:MAG TPA: methyltransferase domain-containing protein [Herpetosiphonaceae bacterium]